MELYDTQVQNKQYEDYIWNHIRGVKRAFKEYGKQLCHALEANYDFIESRIRHHDDSKFSCDEFTAYRMKFFPCGVESISQSDYDRALSHHYHNNKHHPEYWVIPKANGNILLDMPMEYIIEMICDWQSFKYAGKGDAYNYYYNVDRKEGLLSDRTRKFVEIALDVLKEVDGK